MPDYGQQLGFGLNLIPEVDLLEENRRLAGTADEAGLDPALEQVELFATKVVPTVSGVVADRRA